MRLDFNVLWVDDQAEELSGTKDAIARRIASEGFQLQPTFCSNIAEVEHLLAQDVFTDEIDLVLVDWELGSGDQGQNAIDTIRERIPHKDIVFYSARTDTAQLRRLAFELSLDGLFFSDRRDLVNEVEGVFESLVKKALDLDHIRGIVMGATSDIEHMTRECLTIAHDLSDDAGKASILAEMYQILDAKGPSLASRVGALKASGTAADVISAHMTFTAHDGARVLSRLLKAESFRAHGAHRESVTIYMEKVAKTRNNLGHKVLNPEGKPIGIAGESSGEEISFEDLKDFRKVLLDLRERFRSLRDSLTAARPSSD